MMITKNIDFKLTNKHVACSSYQKSAYIYMWLLHLDLYKHVLVPGQSKHFRAMMIVLCKHICRCNSCTCISMLSLSPLIFCGVSWTHGYQLPALPVGLLPALPVALPMASSTYTTSGQHHMQFVI